jgi:hypothetical protein
MGVDATEPLAEQLKHTLQPISPTPAFRTRLRDGLQMAGHYRDSHQLRVVRRGDPQWSMWLACAATAGACIGIAALILRSRRGKHA